MIQITIQRKENRVRHIDNIYISLIYAKVYASTTVLSENYSTVCRRCQKRKALEVYLKNS